VIQCLRNAPATRCNDLNNSQNLTEILATIWNDSYFLLNTIHVIQCLLNAPATRCNDLNNSQNLTEKPSNDLKQASYSNFHNTQTKKVQRRLLFSTMIWSLFHEELASTETFRNTHSRVRFENACHSMQWFEFVSQQIFHNTHTKSWGKMQARGFERIGDRRRS